LARRRPAALSPPAAAEEAPKEAAKALDPKKWVTFPLIEREDINHNTRRYRFGLPTAMHDLGLPVGQHIFIKGTVEGKPVMRAYTPLGHGPGYVDFVIKAYFPLEPRFPNGGLLTMHMEKLAVGDTMQFKGPLGEYVFNTAVLHPRTGLPVAQVEGALSTFSKNGQKTPYKVLGLIAGGSGITPCLQVATALLEANADVRIKLLYANQSPDDILCQQELDAIAADARVDVWYTVDRVAEGAAWPYSQGFISEDMLREHMPVADEHTCIFMCGPPPMLDRACKPNLAKLGHPESRMHCF
jgi:NAD(P)H-flavin reductase